MHPTTVFCPHLACPARGQTGQGNIGIHSRQEKRFIWTQCRTTCTTPNGTAWYRLRTSTETVPQVVTLMAHGCPLQAIVVAFGVDERTVAAWLPRAGVQGPAVQEPVVEHPRALGQVHADEIRVKKPGGVVWMALAMMGSTRLWRAGDVSARRDLTWIRPLIERVRACALRRPLLCCTDGLASSMRAMRETFRDPVQAGVLGRPRVCPWRHSCIAQVVTREVQRRVVAVERRIMAGTPARVETLRRRAPGDGVINTADIERLHATFRERLASLTRRRRALARCTPTLRHGMYLSGTVYNFCTYHASVRLASPGVSRRSVPSTPAMAAGITDHGWTIYELLSCHVPPPHWRPPKRRGRPARALQQLIERWCS